MDPSDEPSDLYAALAATARFVHEPLTAADCTFDDLPEGGRADWHAVVSAVLGHLCLFSGEQLRSLGLPVGPGATATTDLGGVRVAHTVLRRGDHLDKEPEGRDGATSDAVAGKGAEPDMRERASKRPGVVVRVDRWTARRGWRWWGRGGLVLYLAGLGVQGVTQTYRSRSLDDAREMVVDYLRCSGVEVADDVAITWIDRPSA